MRATCSLPLICVTYSVIQWLSKSPLKLKDMINMKFVLLLSLFVVFMATGTEGGNVEDAIRFVFDALDGDSDGKLSSSDASRNFGE